MKYFYFTIIGLFHFYFLCSQEKQNSNLVYLRYNGDIVTDNRFNTVKVYELVNDSTYYVKEVRRFTKKPTVKSVHYENLKKEKHGIYKSYNKKGQLMSEGFYDLDKKEGVWNYYKDNKLNYQMPYKKGKKEGVARYYMSNGHFYNGFWKNDKPDGAKEKYDSIGNLIFKGQYKNGKLDGLNIWYFSNGNKQKEAFYKNGELNEIYKDYYKNGMIKSIGKYDLGNRINDWVWYYENGKVASKELYNSKGKIKKAVFYDKNGRASNGKRHLIEGVIDEKKKINRFVKKYIKDNFSYPIDMRNQGFEGKVFVVFKIDKLGEVKHIQARGDAHEDLIKKAVEIVKSIPTQKPAKTHNLYVDIQVAIPIRFHINE